MTPPVFTSLSSTGTGKTTLMIHLAYLFALEGWKVALIELDNRNSFRDCCGLINPTPNQSTAAILTDNFDGQYPWLDLWTEILHGKAQVCQAERFSLDSVARQLTGDPLGVFRLKEILEHYPLNHDVVLVDAPGQQGQLSLMALFAATHLIVCTEMTQKCISDIDALFQWLHKHQNYAKDLEIVGIVPGRYEHEAAIQRNTLDQFPGFAQNFNTQCFAPIRKSPRFMSAYAEGISIFQEAPGTPLCKDFTVSGNLFKEMSPSRLKGLDQETLKNLPAIAPYISNLVKEYAEKNH